MAIRCRFTIKRRIETIIDKSKLTHWFCEGCCFKEWDVKKKYLLTKC